MSHRFENACALLIAVDQNLEASCRGIAGRGRRRARPA
jgi:hypothetical protein